jgi:membrane protease YdiL (CAAX protease family)
MDNPDHFAQEPVPKPPPSPPPLYPPPSEAFLVLFVALAATLILGTATLSLGKTGIFLSEIFFLVPPLIYLHRKGYNLRRCLRWNGVSGQVLVSTILIGLALVVLLDEMDRLVNLFFPMPEELQDALTRLFTLKTWVDYLIVGLGVVVIAAICEESLFRGFMQVSFEAQGSVTRAVLFTALLFALAHFNPWWMVQILILGVFLGFFSWRSASTIPGMIIHGLNNGLALLAGGDTTGAGWGWYNAGHHVAPAILIGALALLFLGLKLFIRSTEESFREDVIPDETSVA